MKKVSGGATTVYVYDAFGNLDAEYSSQTPTSPCGTATCYLVTDHLGSTRMLTDIGGSNGTASNTVHRYDFLPFGGELLANVNGRTAALGYSSTLDTMNPRFTGQMRDPETYDANGQTALDWFNVRHMSGAQGRFQSPDPGNAGADLANPQTWNGYAYVGNNPLSYTDPTGEIAWAALPALCGPAAPYCAAALGAVAVILGIDAGGPESHPLPTQPAGQGVTNPGNFGARFSPYPSTGGGSFFSGPLPLLGPTLSVPDRAWRAGHAGANFNMIANCQQVDPILGALEFTFKLGPEIEVGPVKAGFSFYKNATTGEKGVTIEANAGLASIQAEQQTPQGGFVNGGSFEDFTRTASFMATQYDFRSGQVTPKPTKSFRGGLQAVLGIEVAFNPETAKRVARSNIACKALRGE